MVAVSADRRVALLSIRQLHSRRQKVVAAAAPLPESATRRKSSPYVKLYPPRACSPRVTLEAQPLRSTTESAARLLDARSHDGARAGLQPKPGDFSQNMLYICYIHRLYHASGAPSNFEKRLPETPDCPLRHAHRSPLYLEQRSGRVKLRNPPVVHDEDAVGVHDGVEPVGDGEHSTVSEGRPIGAGKRAHEAKSENGG